MASRREQRVTLRRQERPVRWQHLEVAVGPVGAVAEEFEQPHEM